MDAIADVIRGNPLALAFILTAVLTPAFALCFNTYLTTRVMTRISDKVDENLRVTRAVDHAVNDRPPSDSTLSEDMTEMRTRSDADESLRRLVEQVAESVDEIRGYVGMKR